MPITEAQLKAATKILPPDSFPIWVSILNAAMARWEIDRPNRIIDFMAHALHESAEFTKLGEGLNYSPAGLANTWRNRFAARLPSGDYALDLDAAVGGQDDSVALGHLSIPPMVG